MTDHLMKPAGQIRTTLIGLYMIAMAMLLTYVVFCLFPERVAGENNKLIWNTALKIFRYEGAVSPETRLLLLVMAMGALGSYIHAATSFVSYVGNRSFIRSWTWWYMLRPFIGVSLAIIFYFVVRGGFLSAGADASDTSPYGFAALAGLVGMFSKQATDKLEELFGDLLVTRKGGGDQKRGDKLSANRPAGDLMIRRSMIKTFNLVDSEDRTALSDLQAILAPGITRIPVLDASGALRYLVHKSVLAEFQANWKGTHPPTLADLAGDAKIHALIYDATVFVAETVTAGEAKAKMDSEPACQDVIVTKNGKRDEPVLGWLTNIELGKISRI
jgi:hypothetical protein